MDTRNQFRTEKNGYDRQGSFDAERKSIKMKKKKTITRAIGIVLGWLVMATIFLGLIALVIKLLRYIF